MARRWPRAKAPLKPKYGLGDIVKKSSMGIMRFSSSSGEPTGDVGTTGTPLICYVVRSVNDEYLVQVIPHMDIQDGVGRMHKGKFGFVEARYLSQGSREKAMTAAKVYDGEKFHESRMKDARNAAAQKKGRSYVDR
jgi:hypothetical protein